MSKTTQVKADLDSTTALMGIIEILKDIASNHFYKIFRKKGKKDEFERVFDDFFQIATNVPEGRLILNSEEKGKVAILAFTSEGGFMADLTAKIVRTAITEAARMDVAEFIIVGKKGYDKITPLTDKPVTLFAEVERKGFYEISVGIKDHVLQLVKEKKITELVAVYPRAKTISLIKNNVVKLFPPEDLLAKQGQVKSPVKTTTEKIIFESDPSELVSYLAGVWISFRVYQMLEDCSVSGYAAQAQQLESSLETLNNIKKKMMMNFRKAKRGDIDKSLREVFTASLMNEGK
ncbi:MAG TPA: F0F1 ATP synthase subunit gamma [Candidatus Omnitrophota bacterium]|nr:F0F1 ATP synthase subunit gamma [Candidatus Omnitrophota bacterium]HPS19601.1 F0F1 ATP synthase subunit gamma [Candidatus Omnitrophota bacterium]